MAGSGYGSAYQGTSFESSSYGSAGEWNSVLNNPPESSSDSSGSSTPASQTIIGVADFTFRCIGKGLKPNTLHKAYLLTKDVSADCAPIVGSSTSPASNAVTYGSNTDQGGRTYSYGVPLVSDAAGNLVFDYHFRPENSPYEVKKLVDLNKTIAIIPYGQQLFKVSNSDGSSYAQSYIESKRPS